MRIQHLLVHRRTLSAATGLVVLLAMVSSAAAITRDEVVALTQAGLGDEVIVNKIQADRSTFTLSTDDILALKKDGVSDRVLAAMIQTQIAPAAGQPAAAPQAEPAPSGDTAGSSNPRRFPAPAPESAPSADSEAVYNQPAVQAALPRRATVLFSNQTATDLAISVDAITRTLYFRYPSSSSAGMIVAGGQHTFSLEPGIYGARWYGDGSVQNVAIACGALTKFILSTMYDNGTSGIGLTILSGDAVISSGMLYCSRPPFRVVERRVIQPVPVCPPATVTRCETDYYPGGSTTTCQTYSSGCESPVVYETPRTVYVQRPVYYEQPRYYYEQPRREGSLLGRVLTPNTVLYGGLGAIIGHNTIKHHGTEKGLLYGALLGQFLDR